MILNINKPKEWSSFDVVKKVRSELFRKDGKKHKVGHAGTLDPLATGVLIVLTDKDTKKQNEFMSLKKEYEFEMMLGVTSATYDLEGPFEFSEDFEIPGREEILKAFNKYEGKIKQQVPAFSAVKHKGKPLYKYARKGKIKKEMLPIKEVTIYELELLDFWPKKQFPVTGKPVELPLIEGRVKCSKGTYVRSLVHDIGEELKTGATLAKLIRTRIGPYSLEEAKNVESLFQSVESPYE